MSDKFIDSAELEKLSYPIGKFSKPETITTVMLHEYIGQIEHFPEKLTSEVVHLNQDQLDTIYRPQGWTIRQVVHHCADSHMNSLVRFKLALTEDNPIIKPYFEDRWAKLSDSELPVEASLQILRGLHKRWVFLMKSLSEEDLAKEFVHPEHGRKLILKDVIPLYAWHCKHHLAHITTLKQKKGWV